MRKQLMAVVLMAAASLTGAGEGPGHGTTLSPGLLETLQRLAGEKEIVADIESQNLELTDAGLAQELQVEWRRGSDHCEVVQSCRRKDSSRTMKDYFEREITLVDCYTLDSQGRVVGSLYKPQDFLQDQEPQFADCYDGGMGRLVVGVTDAPGAVKTLEISVPVKDRGRTVGVLVATVLADD